jgi:hypothetical protein
LKRGFLAQASTCAEPVKLRLSSRSIIPPTPAARQSVFSLAHLLPINEKSAIYEKLSVSFSKIYVNDAPVVLFMSIWD